MRWGAERSVPLLREEIPAAEVLPENNDQAGERIRLEIEVDDNSDATPMAPGGDEQC
jgi:hypothetical protein